MLYDHNGNEIPTTRPNWPPRLNIPKDAKVKSIETPYTSGGDDYQTVTPISWYQEYLPRTKAQGGTE